MIYAQMSNGALDREAVVMSLSLGLLCDHAA